jgi:hypothetical protein
LRSLSEKWQIGWLKEDIKRSFAKWDLFNSPAWKKLDIIGSPLPNAGEGPGVREIATHYAFPSRMKIQTRTPTDIIQIPDQRPLRNVPLWSSA